VTTITINTHEHLAVLWRAWTEPAPVSLLDPALPSTRAVLEEMRDRLIADRDDPDMQTFLGDILRHIDRIEWVLARLPEDV
jgi:hypothetical protein